jgi:ribulose-5-phosphate 4-epimerase/fuculose-1-phosphate aldolase
MHSDRLSTTKARSDHDISVDASEGEGQACRNHAALQPGAPDGRVPNATSPLQQGLETEPVASLASSRRADDNRSASIEARIDLAAAFRMAARLNLHEGVCNHFSMMLPGRRFLINPKGTHFERITASGLILIDEAGNTLEGEGRAPMTGHAIHTRIHLKHPRANVVLHLHAPYSTAITAIRGGRFEMVHQNSTRFYGEIAYDDDFNGIAVNTGEGDRMAEAMNGKRIMFLGNHGVVVVGETVARAFDDFYYLERACQVQLLAMQSGRELNIMPDEIARMTHEQFDKLIDVNAEYHFTALKEMLDAEEPSYSS